ncbi:hypothetical protein BOX15_Mlig002501g2 [Macrostomum lignano]|uniref:Uncharacterized protein n=1 Tax=Macrostomum lignano TaxID=282301 RepID=A0A267GLI4_9PLAT|nr:hypothetical protein BOX15_Mlig027859g1 [Macrostomum lignano]PAA86881.1 hypothetical protein BOX15_Mlig002501g2 [Macrostomum lignano]
MKLLWVLIAVAAVAAPIAFTDAKALPAQELDVSDWREKAIEMLERAIARLEDAIAKLPEDSRLRPYLNKALEYLRRKLTDLQDAAFNFGESDRVDFLEGLLERLEQALERLPEGPLRDRLQQNIDRIRDLLNSLRPEEDAIVVTDRVRELLDRIRRLINKYKEEGNEALLRFLNSDLLERLVSRLPEPIQSEVRERIDRLKERLESSSLSVSDWREKAIEMLERAIARLEDAIAKLPEDSRLRAYLSKALGYLRRKLTDLQDAAFNFGESDRVEFLEGLLERLEQALERLPEGPLRDRLQQNIDRIRDLLNSLRPEEDAIVVTDRVRELLDRIRRLINKYKEEGNEALLRFLNSDLLERLVSRLPEPIQSEVRERIDRLKERLESSSLSVSDWREKAIEMLERAIARLEDAIAKLPEDSRLRAYLNKALEYLRRKLTDLQDAAFNFGESDRVEFLERILERLEQALERLPEGPLRDRLQQNIDRIRDLLNN